MKYGGKGSRRQRRAGVRDGTTWPEIRTTGGAAPFALTQEEAIARLAAAGRRGDSELAHVTPGEAAQARTTHPRTGLPEFWAGGNEEAAFGDPLGGATADTGPDTHGGRGGEAMADAAIAMGLGPESKGWGAHPVNTVGEFGGLFGAIGQALRGEPISPDNIGGLLSMMAPGSTALNQAARAFEGLLEWTGLGPYMVEHDIVERSGPPPPGNPGEDQNASAPTAPTGQAAAATNPSLSTAQVMAAPVFDYEAWLRSLPGASGDALRRREGLLS